MRGDARRRYEGYRRCMSFTMAPAFFSTDLERTSKFWGGLGFVEVMRDDDSYMILRHPMGIVIHFGLDPDLVPSENMTNAYLGFTTSEEAVALYEDWVGHVSDNGFIHAPATTFYGMIEWGMTDPDANALRVGGPAEPN
jgi:hypothetical protein